LLTELEIAQARIERETDVLLAAAWASAALQRARRLPKLSELLRRDPRDKQDLQMYLANAKAHLPAITMAEWRARFGQSGE